MKALTLSAVAMFALMIAAPSHAAPVVPPECASMTFTKTIEVNTSPVIIMDKGVLLVFGRSDQPNNITVPNATQVCLVGGSKDDALTGGRGDDILVGNGAVTRDHLNAQGGYDTCYGDLGTIYGSCEVIY